jgi:Flp pilus assembly protein TadD
MYRAATLILTLTLTSPVLLSAASDQKFEFRGKVLVGGAPPVRDLQTIVYLYGATFPFQKSSRIDLAGQFGFKDLRPGTYRVSISIQNWGEMERTIDIGPGLADEKGRVWREFEFEPGTTGSAATVVTTQLSLPRKALSLFASAEKRLGKHDVDGAKRDLNEAIEVAPHFSAAWNLLGTIAFQSGEYQTAESCFRTALEHDPSAYPPLVNLGAAELALGKLEEAREINRRATLADPKDPLAHSQLGQTLFHLGEHDEAIRELKEAISLEPGHFSYPQLVLAEIYRLREEWPLMLETLREFCELHPDSPVTARIQEMLQSSEPGPG